MQTRSSCDDLILFVMRLVNDEDNTYHSRVDVQVALDRYRVEARYRQLDSAPSYAEGGTASYLTFDAPDGLKYWETDAEIVDHDYTVLTPSSSDFWNGRWSFTTAQDRPLRITGYYHDPYNAAADLLEIRLAQLAEAYDFRTADGDTYNRSQAGEGIARLIAKYRAQGGAGGQYGLSVSTLVRTDVSLF